MRRKSVLALGTIVILTVGQGLPAVAKKVASLSKDQKIVQALNRLTFGPRAGEFERVKRIGLKKWIDQQLHPETIAENPRLEEKIRWLDSLRMTQAEMTVNYPSRQLVLAMARGRVPYPDDPQRRALIERVAARYDRRLANNADLPKPPQLASILTPEQMRIVRSGTPEQKIEMFRSLPRDTQDQFIESMPQGMRLQMINFVPPDVRRKLTLAANPEQLVVNDLMEGKLLRAVYSNRQLEEILTDFWFNHFNVFLDKGADRFLTTVYERDSIRKHVFGKFHDLLLATAESPAMLFYLDNWQSSKPSPNRGRNARGLNENYGRELLELHTLGVDGGYTQHDVTEVARCFTGWTIKNLERSGGEYLFNPVMHDQGEKTVLGVTIPAGGGREDGLKVLEIIAHHPSTARFLSRKLAQRFVADNPPPSLIDKMTKTFHDKDGDLREVMKTMFNAPEFWSRGAFRSKVKSPLEMVASSLRATNADIDSGFALVEQIAKLGEPLYRKQEPTGYSNQSQEWVNSASLLARMNFGLALISNKIPGVKIDESRFQGEDPKKIARTLLLADLPPKAEAAIEASLKDTGVKPAVSKPLMVAGLTIGSPEFQKR
jgi:uncharacterized protein (DUF1800 family)